MNARDKQTLSIRGEDMTTTATLAPRHLALAAACATVLFAAPAHADLVQIAWDSSGRFERNVTVAPAKFAEVCGKLSKGQAIAWSFRGQQSMNFNIHYHEGKKVVFPIKQSNTASLEGTLTVPVDQDYCWMWENKGGTPAAIDIALQRG